MEKYGFVYIWYDKKRKMYYIGCHWGTEDDGYICSSTRMKNAYKRRPDDFRRRILKRVYNNKKELLEEEFGYLKLIDNNELGKKYYNLRDCQSNHWFSDENSKKTVSEKISESHKSNPNFGKWNIGLKRSEETKKKISQTTSASMKKYYRKNRRTEETRKKISENNKRLQKEGKIGMKGKKHSSETKKLMSENNAMNNPKNIQKVKDSKKGIRWLENGSDRKMAVPGTEKYNMLIYNGYKLVS